MHGFACVAFWFNFRDYRGLLIPVVDLFYTCTIESLAALQRDPSEVQSAEFCQLGPEHLENMAFDSNRRALIDYQASLT